MARRSFLCVCALGLTVELAGGMQASGRPFRRGNVMSRRRRAQGINGTVSFLTVGDWGVRGDPLMAVAKQMGKVAADMNAAFVISLGDNYYEQGVESDTDPQWQTTYRDVFTADSLQVPFYAIRGNHDMRGNPSAEIDYYLNQRDSRWYMPHQNYSVTVPLCADADTHAHTHTHTDTGADGGGCGTLDMVFIDTQTLAPEANEAAVKVPSDVDQLAVSQLEWIEQTLAKSTADFLLVAGHYPVYSKGEHGDTPSLITKLTPLLHKYKVDAYLCGHDHTLQHLQDDGVHYFVSGNGCKMGELPLWKRSKAQALYAKVEYGFTSHQLSRDGMATTMWSHDGKELYSFEQQAWRTKADGQPTVAVPASGGAFGGLSIAESLLIAGLVMLGLFSMTVLVAAWRIKRRNDYRNLAMRDASADISAEFEDFDDWHRSDLA